jgi:hypothetical protein
MDAVSQALALHDSQFQGRRIRVTVCGKRFKSKNGGNNPEEQKVFEGKRSTRDGAMRRMDKKKQFKEHKKKKRNGEYKGTNKGRDSNQDEGSSGGSRGGSSGGSSAGWGGGEKRKFTPSSDSASSSSSYKKARPATSSAKPFTKKPAAATKPKPAGKKPKHGARKAAQAVAASKGEAYVKPKK